MVSLLQMINSTQLRVLVVDDDPDIRTLVATYLGSQGVGVFEASCELELQAIMKDSAPDVVLLDVNLGPEDGFSIARNLRHSWNGGLIMITGRGDTIDRVVGLEIGADDYVAKPFDLRELLARIKSVSRRTARLQLPQVASAEQSLASEKEFKFDRFVLSLAARELRDEQNQVIPLTSGEFALLVALVENRGRILSRDQLLQITHRREAAPFDRTIDVQIGRLRKKLKDIENPPRLIKSVRSQGYLFAPEPIQRN
jgi:two-component system, OmpR family, response regulator